MTRRGGHPTFSSAECPANTLGSRLHAYSNSTDPCPLEMRRNIHKRPWCFNSESGWQISARFILTTLLLFAGSSQAAFINFENCLGQNVINANGTNGTNGTKPLQFVPLNASATLDTSSASHNLNYTVYGNITGSATIQNLPALDDPSWKNPNDTLGKIPDLGGSGEDQKYTTFSAFIRVLGYTAYEFPQSRLCNTSALTPCPFAPVFNDNVNG